VAITGTAIGWGEEGSPSAQPLPGRALRDAQGGLRHRPPRPKLPSGLPAAAPALQIAPSPSQYPPPFRGLPLATNYWQLFR